MSTVVQQGSLLDDVAKLRLQSLYATSKPLHMLPPTLLRYASLSDEVPNECITAIIQLDAYGKIIRNELVRSIIAPVRVLSFDEVDDVISGTHGMRSSVHKDLAQLNIWARRRAQQRGARGPDVSESGTSVRWRETASGGARLEALQFTPARVIVGEGLLMYSYAARGSAKRHNLLRLPQTENQRIGTTPLRRYADMISQRQLSSALRGEPGLPPGEVAAIEIWVRGRWKAIQEALAEHGKGPRRISGLHELEALCARQAAATKDGKRAELDAEITRLISNGTEVELKLSVGELRAHAKVNPRLRRPPKLWPGKRVRVRLRSVDTKFGTVHVDLLPPPRTRQSGRNQRKPIYLSQFSENK